MLVGTSHSPGKASARACQISGQRSDGVAVFRGIRYAEAPIGNLRLAAIGLASWAARAGSSVAPLSTIGAE